MARNDGRIEKGQRLSSAISAKAWNRAQDAADVVLGVQPGASADGQSYGSAPYQWVYAKNGTGSDLARWGVMAITGVEVTPTSDDAADATKQFQAMPVLTGGTPSTGTTAWCVAVEPIKSNSIGRVAVSGVVQVKAADINKATGSTTLWQNASWALIRFGGGAAPAIRLAQTSGQWPNEPPFNVKAVQLFRQQTEVELGRPAQPWEWVPETDEFGDPVFAVAINWFSHVPVGQGDLIKWCAVIPISNLAGEYDTGQVTYNDGEEVPIMRPYDKLWLLIAVEC